jgi:hypothetical protein
VPLSSSHAADLLFLLDWTTESKRYKKKGQS